MPPKSNETLLGRIALHCKMITVEQLEAATREQGLRNGQVRLGDVLLEQGAITQAQLAKILAMQRAVIARHVAAKTTAQHAPTPEPEPQQAPPSRAPDAPTRPTRQPGAEAAASPPAMGSGVEGGAEREALHAVLREAIEAGASDVHLHSGAALAWRQHGELVSRGDEPLDPERVEAMLVSILTPEQRAWLQEHGELDFAYGLADAGRFRANVYRQQRGMDGTFRAIPAQPPSLDELGLPSMVATLTNFHQGMVLVTGPSGCGKSSTLAALLNIVNEERSEHILTVEDPIEVLHPSKRGLVNQRQVRRHTESFARALRAALREDPDVIAIGELRDLETISLALTAAETGHLVLATLHTSSAVRTIDRLIGAFPPDQQAQVRTMLSESLRAVVSQRLVPCADGSGRTPAVEILLVNKAVGNLIRDAKTFQIRSILQTGASQGMCLLDESLSQLVRAGTITREAALRHCEDPKRFGGAGA